MKSSKYWRVNERVDSIKTVGMMGFRGEILRMIVWNILPEWHCLYSMQITALQRPAKSSSYCVSNHILSALTISRASST